MVYLGNSGVGKSSVIRWLSTGSFRSETEATIGELLQQPSDRINNLVCDTILRVYIASKNSREKWQH